MRKNHGKYAKVGIPLSGKPESQLDRIDVFKKMCRMLELKRRAFLDSAWRNFYADDLPQQQFIHLMMLRLSLPCNLARVMEVTGLSSAGASILVNKLVGFDLLVRRDDPDDRRNVIIDFTPKGMEMCRTIEDRLNRYIFGFFETCPEQELEEIEQASRVICRVLDNLG